VILFDIGQLATRLVLSSVCPLDKVNKDFRLRG